MYDMKHLTKLKKLGELAPEAWKGFMAFDEAAFKAGVIPLKYKELMAVAVALTTQCPYCIEIHAKRAKKAGATEQELDRDNAHRRSAPGRRRGDPWHAYFGLGPTERLGVILPMEPMTLFARTSDPAGVVQLLRRRAPAVTIDGDDAQWHNAVVTCGTLTLTLTHDPDYYSGPGWSVQMDGMCNYLQRFPNTDRKMTAISLPTTFKFALGVVASPDLEASNDPRFELLLSVVQQLDGILFTPSSLLDAHGRILCGAGGEDEEDPEAVWPQVLAEITIPDAHRAGDPDSAPSEAEPAAVPSPQRVARRALAMTALTARAILEQAGVTVKPPSMRQGRFRFVTRWFTSREGERQELLTWVETIGVGDELEPNEWEVLQRPIGRLEAFQQVNATWRLEGLVVLAWALGRYELPRHDQTVPVDPLLRSLEIFNTVGAKELLVNPRLRPREEIGKLRGRLFAVNWRLVNQRVNPGVIDFAEFARTCWFGPLDVSGLPLVDGDLALAGKRLDRASSELFGKASSIAVERHHAVNWLWEGPERYSDASEDT
jgi:AhpD family alkylhydroperoxidase